MDVSMLCFLKSVFPRKIQKYLNGNQEKSNIKQNKTFTDSLSAAEVYKRRFKQMSLGGAIHVTHGASYGNEKPTLFPTLEHV